jgi:hypothetical protein
MMKKVLIVSPHFPPSNLTAVHRARLFANHLSEFGWEPIILTVHERYYEEELDPDLAKLLPEGLRIEKVKALSAGKPRLIGDVGLRGFFPLYQRAKRLIQHENIDFLYITIPSFYGALLGRWLHHSTRIRYGIDYIDPWVHQFPGSTSKLSRAHFSTLIARFLEPIAVKKASLITGVADAYYQGVLNRNPHLAGQCITGSMPYGGEKRDHEKIKDTGKKPYLFQKKADKLLLVYAGTLLPRAFEPLEAVLQAFADDAARYRRLELHFVGSGRTFGDAESYQVKPLAEKYGLWNTIVFEYPKRIPYLDALVHLDAADGIFILGSVEPHYTPSKLYQGVLTGKPILAVLHEASNAVPILRDSRAGIALTFNGADPGTIRRDWPAFWDEFDRFRSTFTPDTVDTAGFDRFSATAVTGLLAGYLDRLA